MLIFAVAEHKVDLPGGNAIGSSGNKAQLCATSDFSLRVVGLLERTHKKDYESSWLPLATIALSLLIVRLCGCAPKPDHPYARLAEKRNSRHADYRQQR